MTSYTKECLSSFVYNYAQCTPRSMGECTAPYVLSCTQYHQPHIQAVHISTVFRFHCMISESLAMLVFPSTSLEDSERKVSR